VGNDVFVTGTDTGVGKTLLSALLVAALDRNYWKPIQTGAIEGTDREAVKKWAGVSTDRTFPEAYVFDPPVAPHLAAEQQGVTIDIRKIAKPSSLAGLIIEGAGGVFVPVNRQAFMLDVMRQLGAPVLIASRTALGTINHTLLTIHAIRQFGVELKGVVMIGEENSDNRRAVEHYGSVPVVGYIPWLKHIDGDALRRVYRQHFYSAAFI
jgi:dethiobiotin synthase